MLRTCNEEDWRYWPDKPAEAPCGRRYDDVDHSTICPHEPLPPKLSEGELSDLWERMKAEEEASGERPSG